MYVGELWHRAALLLLLRHYLSQFITNLVFVPVGVEILLPFLILYEGRNFYPYDFI